MPEVPSMPLMKSLLQYTAGALVSTERLLRRTRNIDPASVASVLILEYYLPLGCCVHLTPLYAAIKRCRPDITITVATHGLAYDLLRHNPHIDHLIRIPDPIRDLSSAARTLSAELSRLNLKPDCTLTGVSDQRTRAALLALLCGTGWRGGFTQATELYQRPLRIDPALSLIDNNLRLAALAGCSTSHLEPAVFFSPANLVTARSMAARANPDGKPLLVFVTQNSGGQSTGWHTERFVQVIHHAHHTLGCNITYVGTAGDIHAIESLRLAAGSIGTSFAGRTTVTELAALLALTDCVISLDTGAMHVGRAVGVPMVVIGPSWQKPIEWLPIDVPNTRILRGPDRHDVPPNYKLDEVEAVQVINALEQLLTLYPPHPASRSARLARSTSSTDHHSDPLL
jgi:ADP-heptose:LPS heptosyltransferase